LQSVAQASLKQIKKIKLRSYKELAARTKRKEELSVLVQKLQTQRNLMVSGTIQCSSLECHMGNQQIPDCFLQASSFPNYFTYL
jgi:hypothetical protein